MAARRTVEVDLLDIDPGHVLGALTAIDEDQHAGMRQLDNLHLAV